VKYLEKMALAKNLQRDNTSPGNVSLIDISILHILIIYGDKIKETSKGCKYAYARHASKKRRLRNKLPFLLKAIKPPAKS
jgi:hypothetical protein